MNLTIAQRVSWMERRINRIEQRLDLPALDPLEVERQPTALPPEYDDRGYPLAPAEIPTATPAPAVIPVPTIVSRPSTPPPLPVVHAPSRDMPAQPADVGRSEITDPVVEIPIPDPIPEYRVTEPQFASDVLPYIAPRPKAPVSQSNLEQAIGLKWAGWIGAVVLLIGAALGVKYAYDQHWFAQLPIWVWPSIIAACGFALIGAGEWVYRKVNVIPAASLFGAGVATLFLVSYIGHSYYELYSPATAFILMALTTLIGSAVAMRGKLVSIAVLSLIGGNVAPLVMGDHGAPHSTFMMYLLMLEVIALSLAWWGRSARWWTLRGVSLATTALWMSAIIASQRDGMLPLYFAAAFAVLYHAEVILSALRFDRLSAGGDPAPQLGQTPHVTIQAGGSVFLTLVTAALTATILTVLKDATGATQAIYLVAEAVACLFAGIALRNPARRLTSSLVPAYQACAIALISLAVPTALDGMSVEIGWAILAIALACVARSTRSRLTLAGAVVAWFLALLHLVLTLPSVDLFREHPPVQVWLTISGVEIASTTIRLWGLALIGHIVGAIVRSDDEETDKLGGALGAIATIVWVATSIIMLPPLGATLSLIGFSWLMMGLDLARPKFGLAMHSISVLLIATVKWVVIDTLGQRLSPEWSASTYAPIVNPLMGVGLLLAGSLVGVYRLRRGSIRESMSSAKDSSVAAWVATAVVALLAIALSFEIDRVVERAILSSDALGWPAWQLKQMAWTMLWSASSVCLVFVLTRIDATDDRSARWVNAISFFATALVTKFILLDTLAYRLFEGPASARVVMNLQTMTAATVVGSLVLIRFIAHSAKPQAAAGAGQRNAALPMLALFVVAWTGTFEIERFLLQSPSVVAPWRTGQFTQMAWTMWWTICAGAGLLIGKRFDPDAHPGIGWPKALRTVILLAAVKFMLVDALFGRVLHGATQAGIVANIQMLTAAIVIGALVLLITTIAPAHQDQMRTQKIRAGFIAWIIALLAISLEIDRFFESTAAAGMLTDARLAKQVAGSITWSIFAVLSVGAGFKLRLASLRYFGLGLLALTLLKVVVIDLGQVSKGYRILSFLGLGLLMLGTSVLYGKLSPKLLGESANEPPGI